MNCEPSSPVITVITRTMGHMPFLRRCHASLAGSQSRVAMEWIIVHDHPQAAEDGIRAFIAAIPRSAKLQPKLVSARGGHRALAANAGLAEATGAFVHFLDDDDIVLPGFHDETLGLLTSSKKFGAAAAKSMRVLERPSPTGETYEEISRSPHYPEVKAISLASMAVNQPFPLISILFRREAILETGPMDENFEVCEDYEFLLRFLCHYDIAVVGKTLAHFHQRLAADAAHGNSAATTDYPSEIAYFRNAMLRRDIKSGHVGLGWLLAVGELSAGSVKTDRLLQGFSKMKLFRSMYGWLRKG